MSVVMPFGGDVAGAPAALATLRGLELAPGDERILADNSESLPSGEQRGVMVVSVAGERSPAHARNAGARASTGAWILFIDSDCAAPRDLVERYFAVMPADDVGALVGQVEAAADGAVTLAARYGASRNFLDQRTHLAHPYRPRAAAANLMVRREAFAAVGGFMEGLRAGEDTDFSWRLQESGWRLELRAEAIVQHEYRSGLRDLRRQWRGYAAGRAWLRRRYRDFRPQPAVTRAAAGVAARVRRLPGGAPPPASPPSPASSAPPVTQPRLEARGPRGDRADRARFAAIDGLLALEEIVGFALSNRPSSRGSIASARTVFVADRFPLPGDPLVELTEVSRGARVEAAARPLVPAPAPAELPVLYREDDGVLQRTAGLLSLLVRRPARVLVDLISRQQPSTWELACVAARVGRARIVPLARSEATARRIAALAGRPNPGRQA